MPTKLALHRFERVINVNQNKFKIVNKIMRECKVKLIFCICSGSAVGIGIGFKWQISLFTGLLLIDSDTDPDSDLKSEVAKF